MTGLPHALIDTPRVRGVLDRLYEEVVRIDPAERERAKAKGLSDDQDPGFYEAMASAYMPITPEFGKLLYALARGSKAKRMVEFGTSFGISTIFLAAALRDNGGGRLITTEFILEKTEQARRNLREAGLEDLVEFRAGDARTTLSTALPDSFDLLLLDGPKALYLDVLRCLEPCLCDGALVASDNTDMAGTEGYRDYIRACRERLRRGCADDERFGCLPWPRNRRAYSQCSRPFILICVPELILEFVTLRTGLN